MTTPLDEHHFPVVIVGAGLAGLTAAVYLAEQGITPLVLEADSLWAGGRLAGGEPDTFIYAGRVWSFRPDHGVHALWGGYHNMRALLNRFLQVRLRESEGEEWINRWGRDVTRIEAGNVVRWRWLPAPFHYLQLLFHPATWKRITPFDFLSLPGFLVSILWTIGFDPIREKSALDGLMMGEYFRGWTPNLRATFTGLGKNLLAAPVEAVNLSAFIAAIRFYTMLRRDSWRLTYFTANSHDTLIQPLIAKIEAMGGKLRHGANVQRLQREQSGWKVSVEDAKTGGMRSLTAQQVILAVPPNAAQRVLCATPDTAVQAETMVFPAVVGNLTVRLWYSVSPQSGAPGGMFTGDFALDNFFWLHRLYDEFSAWHNVTGGSVIEVHLYAGRSLADQPDNNVLILAINEVQRAFPELKGNFVHGVVRRNSANHPCFRVPTAQSLHVETPWERLFACGDWVGYPTPALWMERAVVTGIAAANGVLQAHHLPLIPIIPPRRPGVVVMLLAGLMLVLRRVLGPIFKGIAWGMRWLR